MAGFSKLFSTMWGGSLYGRFEASAVFMVLLSLCDHNGVVDMTPEAVAGTTGWPIDFINKGLKELESPDQRSRTPEAEGRRLILLDEHRNWGWRITNYAKYRDEMRSIERKEYLAEAKRRERARNKMSTDVNTSTIVNQDQPITEADTEADTEATTTSRKNVPFSDILTIYHAKLPELPKVVKLTESRKSHIRQRWLQDLGDLDEWVKYFEIVRKSNFLMGRSKPTNGRPVFRADLMWLCKPENICKVIEGKYHG